MSDRLAEARTAITALLREVQRRGMVESELHFLRGLAETELRSGHCGRALDLARESLRLARDTGIGEAATAMFTSLAEAAGGDVDRALALAHEAVDRAEEDGDLVYLSRALGALGHAQLVAGDASAAVHSLRRVRELEEGLGVVDPARGRWHGDLAEALVRIGEIVEAQDVIDVTRRRALRLERESVLAVLDRAEALVRAAREQGPAERQLASAQDRLGKLGYGLEEARAAYALAGLRTLPTLPAPPAPSRDPPPTTRLPGCSAGAVRCPGSVGSRRRPRPLRPRRPSPPPPSTPSPRPSARSPPWSWRAPPTARSPRACSSASRRWRPPSPGCTGSWGYAPGWTSCGSRRNAGPTERSPGRRPRTVAR